MLAIWSERSEFGVAVAQRLRLAIEMPMKIKLRLEWKRDPKGYEIKRLDAENADTPVSRTIVGSACLREAGAYVVPRSGEFETFSIEGPSLDAPILLKIANAGFGHDGIIRFANSWGLLRWHDETPVEDFHRAIRDAQLLLELPPDRRRAAIEWASGPTLRTDKVLSDGTVLQEPRTLLDFCKREFAHLASTEAKIRRCENCKTYFFGKPGSGERPHYFCQDRCRSAFGNDTKRKNVLAAVAARS
jgi:hypothetical protein